MKGLPRGDGAAFFAIALAAAFAIGVYLRWQQWIDQVLLDDEWHLVHRLVLSTPRQMFLDFGYSDYSIPFGLLYSMLARFGDLSEVTLRLPALVFGIATLVVLPWLVLRRVGVATTTLFAWLLAISPLLVLYSRIARPYAITLLLTWIAVFAACRFLARSQGGFGVGTLAVLAASAAIWLHLPAVCFVAAPILMVVWSVVRTRHAHTRARLERAARLAIPIALLGGALILPPLFGNPEALSLKSGVATPTLATLVGAWYAWLGATSWPVALAGAALALLGIPTLRREVPEAAPIAIGAFLALLLLFLTRPLASQHGIIFARYLLPLLPLILLAVAAGTVRVASLMLPAAPRLTVAAAAGVSAVVIAALLLTSPTHEWVRRPNGHASHMAHYFDFRPGMSPFPQYLEGIPKSPFWRSLQAYPAASRRIAVAPFYFESFHSDVPRWQRESGQAIVPGFLSGLCVDWRWGETPPSYPFDLRNAIRLSDVASLRSRAIDLVVWQKPYRRDTEIIGEETAHCEDALRQKFGAPIYEDAAVAVFEPRW
jgi:hypothetical protein